MSIIALKNHDDIEEYYSLVKSFLMKDEAENNLPLGILERARQEPSRPLDIMISLKVGTYLKLVGIRTGRNLVLVGEKDKATILLDFLLKEELRIDGVIGSSDLVRAFTQAVKEKFEIASIVEMHQGIYKLESLGKAPSVEGRLVRARPADIELLSEWVKQFSLEIDLEFTQDPAVDFVTKSIKEESLFFWYDQESVSMARTARPSENGIAINLVYTPSLFRGKGYATACVYELSRLMLQKYKFCTLYTDLTNKVSNHIYQKIGYKKKAESMVASFDNWVV